MIERHFKLSDEDKISGTLPMNINIDTVISAPHEIIYRNRQTGDTLAIAQVRCKLYDQIIKEHLPAKPSLDQQNFHKKWDSIVDDLFRYIFSAN